MKLCKLPICTAIVLAFAALGACARSEITAEEVAAVAPSEPASDSAPATTSLSDNSAPTGTGPESGTLAPGNNLVRADTNGDGVISRSEAEADGELRDRFSTLDTNGDGVLSSDEWLAASAANDLAE